MAKKLTDKEILNTYRDKTEIEHVLDRSEQYVGSKYPDTATVRIVNENDEIELKKVTYIPALLKVIDEVLSNSVDEYRRNQVGDSTSGVTKVEIEIRKNGHITISDNGGIPSDIHPKNGQPIPVFLFSNLRTSTNYDDTKARNVTGTNGVGATLTNIFSKEFTVRTSTDGKGKVFSKTWKNNLSVAGENIWEDAKGFKGSVFDFKLDLSMFTLDENQTEFINDDMIGILKRRCMDSAGVNAGLEVTMKVGKYKRTWKYRSFKQYISSFKGVNDKTIIGEVTPHWEIYYHPNGEKHKYSIGFVNGSECNMGRHFDVAVEEGISAIGAQLRKAKIKCDAKQFASNCDIFINIKVPFPKYSSQTKEKLVTLANELSAKGKPVITGAMKAQLAKSEIVDFLLDWVKKESDAEANKQLRNLAKSTAKKVQIEKFIDANAKTGRERCEFWLFEGESASSGFRTARDPELQGKYDLRGKVKNTFGMTRVEAYKNKEYREMAMAIGLPLDASKINFNTLRFGKIIIFTDMDVDGDSIFAQLISFFYNFYPEIIERGMLFRAIAPIISVEKNGDVRLFYSVADFDKSGLKGYSVRYLKGTGSMTPEEYTDTIQNSHLQRVIADARTPEVLSDWFGKDTDQRKKYFADEMGV